jgi:hypothetical protein
MIWIYVGNQICYGFDIRKCKLNEMDAWNIQSKHTVECKNLKDNYSSNLKSMSKTISPFLIILTMTHKIKFVSSAAFVSVTWDVIWILVTLTFSLIYKWLEYLWDGRIPVLMDLECLGTLDSSMFLLHLFPVETCRKVETTSVVLSIPQFNRIGVIPQKLVTTRLSDIKLVSKSLRQLFSRQRRQKVCWYILNAHR